MQIYLDPISTTCRPLLLFLAEHGTPAEIVPVQLFQGEHLTDGYAALNPNKCVPALKDGDFVLTESSAILKYLADKVGSPAYPRDLQARARINSVMDWFNTGFYRDFGYGVVYQQAFPQYRFANTVVQSSVVARGEENAARWLSILNDHWLRQGPFLCGEEVTLADYLGASYVSIAEWVGYDFRPYPAVTRWLNRMKARESWEQTQDPWNGLTASLRAPLQKSA